MYNSKIVTKLLSVLIGTQLQLAVALFEEPCDWRTTGTIEARIVLCVQQQNCDNITLCIIRYPNYSSLWTSLKHHDCDLRKSWTTEVRIVLCTKNCDNITRPAKGAVS